jgi:hypothetical protein
MSVPVRLRRPAVLLGVVLALFAGPATIRAAAARRPRARRSVEAAIVESIESALVTEQARSTSSSSSSASHCQLDRAAAALQAARDRIAEDGPRRNARAKPGGED